MSNWEGAKTLKDIAEAYQSVYEKKAYEASKDQDQDGDNDFADVVIARMIASGVPKEKAIAMVKDKSYNKEEVEEVDEKYMGFKKLEASIAAKGGVRNPAAVAASIGRKKYGKEKFQKAAATDHKLGEEHDYEHSMIRVELKTAMEAINRLMKKMGGEGDVEAWVQSKITRAADYLEAAANYIDSGESKVK